MSEDLTPAPPKLLSIGQLSWTGSWIASIQKKLGDQFTVDENGGLNILPETDQGAYTTAASFLLHQRERSILAIRITNRLIGELILNYAATFNVNWTDAIEALGIGDEKSMSSMRKLPRIVSRLGADVLSLEGLTHNHFDVATSFQGPEEPDQLREWNLRIRQILMEAAECPSDRTGKWVADSIRVLQKEFGIEPVRPVGGKVLLDQYATLCYILEHWTVDQYELAGQDRRKILDRRDSVENDLINRGILTIPDAQNFVPPWRKDISEAIDVLEIDQSEDDAGDAHLELLQEPDAPLPQLRVVEPDDDDLPSLDDV